MQLSQRVYRLIERSLIQMQSVCIKVFPTGYIADSANKTHSKNEYLCMDGMNKFTPVEINWYDLVSAKNVTTTTSWTHVSIALFQLSIRHKRFRYWSLSPLGKQILLQGLYLLQSLKQPYGYRVSQILNISHPSQVWDTWIENSSHGRLRQ